jgi:hypothetical protein
MDRSGAISFFVTLAASAVLVGCGTSTASTVDATATPDTTSGYGSPVVAGLIETDDIKESSGLSASECQDVLWTHDDSGNDALIYAMDTRGGHLGTWRVDGAQNVDWESVATHRDRSRVRRSPTSRFPRNPKVSSPEVRYHPTDAA